MLRQTNYSIIINDIIITIVDSTTINDDDASGDDVLIVCSFVRRECNVLLNRCTSSREYRSRKFAALSIHQRYHLAFLTLHTASRTAIHRHTFPSWIKSRLLRTQFANCLVIRRSFFVIRPSFFFSFLNKAGEMESPWNSDTQGSDDSPQISCHKFSREFNSTERSP